MNLKEIDIVKGFMPSNEGMALLKWAEKFSSIGPILEIGTYCGKSTLYLCAGAKNNNENVFTIDHHSGSEEHQLNEEYFDEEIYDQTINAINTLPIFIKNVNKFKATNIIPIVSDSKKVSLNWSTNLGMVFIDGGHSYESANTDYISWEPYIAKKGALVIHDIFENPKDGGQAPYEIYKKALNNGYKLYGRVATIACLIKI